MVEEWLPLVPFLLVLPYRNFLQGPLLLFFFLHFSLGSFAFWLLRVRVFVSFLLGPSVLVGRLTGRGALGWDGAGIACCSKVMCPGRGCLHDLLANFADLQLQTHFGGEGVQMASLEGSGGLSWRTDTPRHNDKLKVEVL